MYGSDDGKKIFLISTIFRLSISLALSQYSYRSLKIFSDLWDLAWMKSLSQCRILRAPWWLRTFPIDSTQASFTPATGGQFRCHFLRYPNNIAFPRLPLLLAQKEFWYLYSSTPSFIFCPTARILSWDSQLSFSERVFVPVLRALVKVLSPFTNVHILTGL